MFFIQIFQPSTCVSIVDVFVKHVVKKVTVCIRCFKLLATA